MTAPRTSTAEQDGAAQPMRGLSARAQALLKPRAFVVFSKATPAKKSPPLEPATMNAFQRAAARDPDQPSAFCQDFRFHTAGYAKWLRMAPTLRPSWPEYRDAQIKAEAKPDKPRKNGHGETPLGPLSKRSAKDYAERQAKWHPSRKEVAA